MTRYVFDLAFDWDSLPKGGFDGFLAWGFANDDNLGAEASLAKLKTGDSFILNLWNISDVADPGVAVVLPADWMTFAAGDVKTQSGGKITPAPGEPLGAQLSFNSSSGNSTIFGDDLPVWNVVQQKSGAPLEVTLSEPGRYFFTFKVDITQSGVTKHFGVDPEMIINP